MERNIFGNVVIIFLLFLNIVLFADIEDKTFDNDIVQDTTLETYFLEFAETIDGELNVNDMTEDVVIDNNYTNEQNIQDVTIDFTLNPKEYFPFSMNELVESEIKYLTQTKRDFLIRSIKKAEDYVVDMRKIFKKYGIPEDLVYLPIIESGFNYHAYSRKGAAGMWQFMPSTATWIGMKRNEWLDERLDPLISCEFAAKYLSSLYDLFDDWYLALAAYNYGRGNVTKAIRRVGKKDYYSMVYKKIIPVETRKYVPRFKATVYIMKHLDEFGLEFTEKQDEYDYQKLSFTSPIGLVAKYSGLSIVEFSKYNPSLRSQFVPGGRVPYNIRLPKENADMLRSNIEVLKKQSSSDYMVYFIKNGDNLSSIANSYGISISNLMSINGISNSNLIWEGQKINIPVLNRNRAHVATRRMLKNSHVVNHGETVSQIALLYGVSADIIARLNNLDNSYFIKIGQVLKIR